MFDSINRMDGSAIDWSQIPGIKKSTSHEGNLTAVSRSVQAEQEQAGNRTEENREKLYKELEKVNSRFEALNHSMRMKFNDEAEQFYVEVFDVRTHEVLESIPAEHVLELAAKLKDMVGFFIDEKL